MSADKEVQFANIDELFGASLDDVADLATFETPPTGAYVLALTTSVKKINNKDAVEAKFRVIETVELKVKDETDPAYRAPSKDGTEFSIAYILGNNVSTGRLKQLLMPIGEALGEKNVGVLVQELVKDITIAATVTNRPDKDDPEKIYAGIKNIVVA